jgi:hypothetical protein
VGFMAQNAAGCFAHGNDRGGSVNSSEPLGGLRNIQLLRKNPLHKPAYF